MKKYFETKDGSLEAVSTKIAQEQPTITKPEPNVKLERKTYFENKPGSLEDAANKVVSEGYIAEAKYSINMADASYIKGSELMKAMRQAKKDGNTKKALDDLDILAGDDEQGISFTAANDNEAVRKAEKALQDYRNKSTRNDRNALFAFDRLELRMVGDKLATSQQKNMFKRVFDKYDNKAMFNTSNNKGPSDLQQFVNKTKLDDMVAQGQMFEGLDPVNKDAVKKKFDDRKDKDIDNDGDVDSSDKFLHKRRKAISKAMKEDLGKEDEPKVKKIIGKLKKASDAHAGQAKDLQKAMTEDDMAKFHKMQKDGKSAEQIAKALDIDVKSTKKLMDDYVGVNVDDKGEKSNAMKVKVYNDPKRGEKSVVDPEPKIKDVIKGEKETTRANGHMTKKKFSEMRMKLGQKGKTETGKEAPVIDTEPKAEKI